MPRSNDGVGAATAAEVDPAAGAVDAEGLAPPKVSALDGVAAAVVVVAVVEVGVAVGLAPNEKEGAAVAAGAAE